MLEAESCPRHSSVPVPRIQQDKWLPDVSRLRHQAVLKTILLSAVVMFPRSPASSSVEKNPQRLAWLLLMYALSRSSQVSRCHLCPHCSYCSMTRAGDSRWGMKPAGQADTVPSWNRQLIICFMLAFSRLCYSLDIDSGF